MEVLRHELRAEQAHGSEAYLQQPWQVHGLLGATFYPQARSQAAVTVQSCVLLAAEELLPWCCSGHGLAPAAPPAAQLRWG